MSVEQWNGGLGGVEEASEVRAPDVAGWLGEVDPAAQDPSYWHRFRARVLTRASGELARRRVMSELTMGQVVSSWARAILPAAAVAAVVAGFVLLREPPRAATNPVGVEELLVADIGDQTIPMALDASDATFAVAVIPERF